MGRDLVWSRAPLAQPAAIGAALAATREARFALGASGGPPWEQIPDVRAALVEAGTPGAVLDGSDLVSFIPLLEAAGRLRGYGGGIQSVAPSIAAAFLRLPPVTELRQQIRRAIDDDGAVTDIASPEIRRIRQRLRDLRRDIVRRLEASFHAPGADSIYQERYVTIRHERYVLPVLASAKSRVRGIVHDRSQSGATLFVEPEALVEDNNELVQVGREEDAEALRIRAALTDAVRAAAPALADLIAGLAELDLVFARAELADRMEAVEPIVDAERTVAIEGARHPLLVAQAWSAPPERAPRTVVPIDIHVDAARPLLVITGPNAGGKTVTLKTLGLLALMAQSGCHLPALPGCRLPVFSKLFALVGDEQSVAENLSTFSGFVRQLREVFATVDARSLVLLDELGAGTDPDDGAALARAVLEELADRGALCVASTHLDPLKGFAATDPRARNASVEFDGARLEPTFRLVYDRPGQSYGLAIGARLGLPRPLIERARSYRSAPGEAMEELLVRLDASERELARRTGEIEAREAEAAQLLHRARGEAEAADARAAETMARARADSQRMLADVRRAVNEEWERLRRDDRSRETLEQSRRRLSEAGRATARPESHAEPGAAAVAAGDRVEVAHLGLKGDVISVDGATATVQAGSVTVKVPLQGLRVLPRSADGPVSGAMRARPAEGPPAGAAAGRRAGVRTPGKGEVASELRLIGRTTDEARDILEKYLDDAFLAGLPSIRIVHGKGTGALRRAVHELLAVHPLVEAHRPGASHEGGDGATIAQLRIT
ncbi:MAG TPA: Smr/MutS family protein [Candidatus Binatia bacterium]|nr:Smr/MutS family protein [Candidatus Binatia bacterium]